MDNWRRERVLTHLDPASSLAVGLLIFSFVLVIAFEASNGFHDTANAVATERVAD
jgi:PiT family inorganic phosphate transporter